MRYPALPRLTLRCGDCTAPPHRIAPLRSALHRFFAVPAAPRGVPLCLRPLKALAQSGPWAWLREEARSRPPASRRVRSRAGSSTFRTPTDVFLELGGVGKTNKALESADVNSVSYQGQQMTTQTTAGRYAAEGGGKGSWKRGWTSREREARNRNINAGRLEHPLPAALLLPESSPKHLLEPSKNF